MQNFTDILGLASKDFILGLAKYLTIDSVPGTVAAVIFAIACVIVIWMALITERLPEPLLSRCPPLELPPVCKKHLIGFERRLAEARRLPDEVTPAIEEMIQTCRSDTGSRSLRTDKR